MSERREKEKTLACGRKIPTSTPNPDPEADYWERLNLYLKKNGLNQSESRNRIVEVILKAKQHFTAADLAKVVQRKFPKIGPATIYRNLPILVAANLLRESLADESRQAVYELESEGHHDHIVCLDCQAIIEFYEGKIETIQNRVLQTMKFREAGHRHVLYAHCEFKKKSTP